mmetsp:Transcript_9205/g.28705  ORF Transcript_9205/g.28705 Transcript_9205/m.28705 type:complete len:263 (+) Transcript_9205:269-1057(+)
MGSTNFRPHWMAASRRCIISSCCFRSSACCRCLSASAACCAAATLFCSCALASSRRICSSSAQRWSFSLMSLTVSSAFRRAMHFGASVLCSTWAMAAAWELNQSRADLVALATAVQKWGALLAPSEARCSRSTALRSISPTRSEALEIAATMPFTACIVEVARPMARSMLLLLSASIAMSHARCADRTALPKRSPMPRSSRTHLRASFESCRARAMMSFASACILRKCLVRSSIALSSMRSGRRAKDFGSLSSVATALCRGS